MTAPVQSPAPASPVEMVRNSRGQASFSSTPSAPNQSRAQSGPAQSPAAANDDGASSSPQDPKLSEASSFQSILNSVYFGPSKGDSDSSVDSDPQDRQRKKDDSDPNRVATVPDQTAPQVQQALPLTLGLPSPPKDNARRPLSSSADFASVPSSEGSAAVPDVATTRTAPAAAAVTPQVASVPAQVTAAASQITVEAPQVTVEAPQTTGQPIEQNPAAPPALTLEIQPVNDPAGPKGELAFAARLSPIEGAPARVPAALPETAPDITVSGPAAPAPAAPLAAPAIAIAETATPNTRTDPASPAPDALMATPAASDGNTSRTASAPAQIFERFAPPSSQPVVVPAPASAGVQDPSELKSQPPILAAAAPRQPAGWSPAPAPAAAPAERGVASALVERIAKPDVASPPAPVAPQSQPAVPATRSETPIATMSPVARMDRVIEPVTPAASPSRDFTVRVPDATERGTDVRFVERGGEVRVSVRTSDTELAQTLRSGLSDFVGRLEHGGIRAEVWRPGADASSPQNQSQNPSPDQKGSGSGRNQPGSQGRENPSQDTQRPKWVEELEATIGKQANP